MLTWLSIMFLIIGIGVGLLAAWLAFRLVKPSKTKKGKKAKAKPKTRTRRKK